MVLELAEGGGRNDGSEIIPAIDLMITSHMKSDQLIGWATRRKATLCGRFRRSLWPFRVKKRREDPRNGGRRDILALWRPEFSCVGDHAKKFTSQRGRSCAKFYGR